MGQENDRTSADWSALSCSSSLRNSASLAEKSKPAAAEGEEEAAGERDCRVGVRVVAAEVGRLEAWLLPVSLAEAGLELRLGSVL